jgi:RNA polymerase sigma factor (sigma-70 family)
MVCVNDVAVKRQNVGEEPMSEEIEPLRASRRRVDNFSIQTRPSLISRLKQECNEDSWEEFFSLYSGLIYQLARRHELPDSEAEDVVQETMLKVIKAMKTFTYDPQQGSFKSWLMTITRRSIIDHFREQKQVEQARAVTEPVSTAEFEQQWDEDWQFVVADEALRRVRESVTPRLFQIFHTYVIQGRSATQTSRMLRVTLAGVYLAKFKVQRLLAREVKKLQATGLDRGPESLTQFQRQEGDSSDELFSAHRHQ